MSSSFPSVPGYIGPVSLKTFLAEHFDLKVIFTASEKIAGRATPHNVFLPINESFLVVVYVARHAPAAPPPAARAAVLQQQSNDHCYQHTRNTPSSTNQGSGSPLPIPHAGDLCSPPAAPPHSSFATQKRTTLGKTSARFAKPAAPWLLYTQADHRPLTHALLQHPWWSSVARLLGPAATAFVELYCPMVVQLEAMAGGVQVLGPALHTAAPLDRRMAAVHRWQAGKRAREAGVAPDVKVASLRKKRENQDFRKCQRTRVESTERVVDSAATPALPKTQPQTGKNAVALHAKKEKCQTTKQKSRTLAPAKATSSATTTTSTIWDAALPRTDVSRTRLYVAQDKEDVTRLSFGSEDIGDVNPRPIPQSLLEALWIGRHPNTFQCVVRAAFPRWQVLRLEQALSKQLYSVSAAEQRSETAAQAAFCLPFSCVQHVFRWMDLKPPVMCPALSTSTDLSKSTVNNDAKRNRFDVGAHLRRVLSTVMDHCRRLDLRGAAVKHLRYLERRCHDQEQGKEPQDLQRLAAPVDVVVSYLRTLLESLRWSAFEGEDERADAPDTAGFFWGTDDASRVRVTDAFFRAVHAWLSAGRHATFPLSRFLDGVPVAQLPWLAGFFTTSAAKAPSAARHARRQRSQVQQRVWLQFALFMTQDVLPFLVRATFTVTWSSKNTNQLLFYPAAVWRRVVRAELRRSVSGSHGADGKNADEKRNEEVVASLAGLSPLDAPLASSRENLTGVKSSSEESGKRLCRLTSSADLDVHESRTPLTTCSGGPSLLYANVRFRPDGRKLRPIAILRSASPRSLKKMARGTPSMYCHSAAVLRVLMQLAALAAVQVPRSTADALAWMRQLNVTTGSAPVASLRSPLHNLFFLQKRGMQVHPTPHKHAMKGAFQCLVSGVEEQRGQSGLPKLSNMSHQDEYAELRSFCEDARACVVDREMFSVNEGAGVTSTLSKATKSDGRSECAWPHVFLVRSDASRCYERLPQARVVEEAHALLRHDVYRTLSFTAIHDTAPTRCTSLMMTTLRSTQVRRTIPIEDVQSGKLPRIPRGHIYWELESKEDASPRAGAAPLVSHGARLRALLDKHLQHHLVTCHGNVYEQRVGILQGSPVAMLLCDQLFAQSVDAALSEVLCEHAERSLLLRRVDDVLIATTSAVAAQRCWQAMRRGWPSVGYVSNPKKLTVSPALDGACRTDAGSNNLICDSLVPWCGLLLHPHTLETSVEWRRMRPLLTSVCVADTRAVHYGDREPLLFTQRLLALVHLRLPPTVLCRRINSKTRQLQTFYEVSLLWSRLLVAKVQATLPIAHHRSVAVLLLRPLAACVARLCRLLRRHHSFLQARQSGCGVAAAEVRACVVAAMHRTVQAKLRVLTADLMRHAAARRQQRRNDEPRGKKKLDKNSFSRRNCVLPSPTLPDKDASLRAFWWTAALQIESQWHGALISVRRSESAYTNMEVAEPSAGSTASLLEDTGPLSLHTRALQATHALFSHKT